MGRRMSSESLAAAQPFRSPTEPIPQVITTGIKGPFRPRFPQVELSKEAIQSIAGCGLRLLLLAPRPP
jgi:hypothetical protein